METNVYIETMGCQMNVADSERAATNLYNAGYAISDSSQSADVIIFNTCSVRARAAEKVFARIRDVRRFRNERKPIIGVMGCVAQLEGENLLEDSTTIDFVVGTGALERIPSIVKEVLEGKEKVFDLSEKVGSETPTVSASFRHSPYVAFVPIIEGCNKFCTYCIVPYSRGREKSRTAAEIIEEVKRLHEQCFREVHLIGQNVNSYRPNTNIGLEVVTGATPFSRLLRAVAATGIERIKFTTSFPRDFHTDIVSAIDENENLCNWVHLPVQTGSNRVLRAMRRGYKVEDYMKRVDAIKNARRRIALTSDIIVGFPGETVKEFRETIDLVKYCRYDSLYIFKYSERPGTPAANLEDNISEQEKTDRFLELESIQKGIQRSVLEEYVGGELQVLVEGVSAKKSLDMTGHSTCHKVVNFPGDSSLAGKEVRVRITEAKVNSLYGTMVKGERSLR
ncbi:MAG: tRNA (N6-isopentenyl adenosine(37)-C2)-methylthiotransferase MiaB [Acidobacteriota bacterium]|nr:tRNA (N6-isopentenyl adenosine(37)-C2)-methylthiotransferase MiaB [Acidobacteriota bacterium]